MSRELAPATPVLDEEGLLCALVVAPSTYSRNRLFALYESRAMKRVQRRARAVRSLVREIVRLGEAATVATTPHEAGVEIALDVPGLGYRRRATLSPIEHALVEYLLARGAAREAPHARSLVEGALVRLAELPRPVAGERAAHESPR